MSCKVLLVDDSPARTRQAADRLGALGFEVEIAPTAQDALDKLHSCSAQMIVTNWFIEDMFLHDFAEHAKHVNRDCVLCVYFDGDQGSRPRGMDDPYVDSFFPFAHMSSELLGRAG